MEISEVKEMMYSVIEEMIPSKYRNERYVQDWVIIELKDGTPTSDYSAEAASAANMIKSIKRTTDGVVFTVGDEVGLKWYDFTIPFYVEQFIVDKGRMFVRYDKTSKWEISCINKRINCK